MEDNIMATGRETQGLLEAVIIIEELANDRQKFQEAIRKIQSTIEHGVSKKDVTAASQTDGDTQVK